MQSLKLQSLIFLFCRGSRGVWELGCTAPNLLDVVLGPKCVLWPWPPDGSPPRAHVLQAKRTPWDPHASPALQQIQARVEPRTPPLRLQLPSKAPLKAEDTRGCGLCRTNCLQQPVHRRGTEVASAVQAAEASPPPGKTAAARRAEHPPCTRALLLRFLGLPEPRTGPQAASHELWSLACPAQRGTPRAPRRRWGPWAPPSLLGPVHGRVGVELLLDHTPSDSCPHPQPGKLRLLSDSLKPRL